MSHHHTHTMSQAVPQKHVTSSYAYVTSSYTHHVPGRAAEAFLQLDRVAVARRR